MVRRKRPQTIADTRCDTSRTSRALRRHIPGDTHRGEPAQPVPLVVKHRPAPPRIDHSADALDCQGSLRDGGRKHHLTSSLRARQNRPALLGGREQSIERADLRIRQESLERLSATQHLRLSRQECEDIALRLTVGHTDRMRHLFRHMRRVRLLPVEDLDREETSLRLHHGSVQGLGE